jgi:hypothetical protein
LIASQGRTTVNVGSLNGTETSHKLNREVAIQFTAVTTGDGPSAYDYLKSVFAHDWARGYAPLADQLYLPVVMRTYVRRPPLDYALISEVMINPQGEDTGYEWVEIYYGGRDPYPLDLSLGDALTLGDYGDGRYTFPPGAQLRSGQVIVVTACAPNFSAQYGFNPDYEWTACDPDVPDMLPITASPERSSWEGFGLALGNAGDEILLLDAHNAIVDSAAWGGAPRADVRPLAIEGTFPGGATLKRYPVTSDHEDCAEAFYISYRPSPGYVSVVHEKIRPGEASPRSPEFRDP